MSLKRGPPSRAPSTPSPTTPPPSPRLPATRMPSLSRRFAKSSYWFFIMNQLYLVRVYRKCSLPTNPHVLLFVGSGHNFLKEQEVIFLCFYRSTCYVLCSCLTITHYWKKHVMDKLGTKLIIINWFSSDIMAYVKKGKIDNMLLLRGGVLMVILNIFDIWTHGQGNM